MVKVKNNDNDNDNETLSRIKAFNHKSIEWVVLTKAPIPGLVKTRLIAELGEQGACDVYEQLLARLLGSLSDIASSQVALWIAGNADHKAFEPWSGLATFYTQAEMGDLGERMALAVQSSLARGFIPVLIGVDVPDLDEAYLTHCLHQLQNHDLVISPAADGGYGLLGMKQFYPELFVNKQWGTGSVFAMTKRDIDKLGIEAAYLSEVWDVDELADVQRWIS
ncbi:MAG: rSAM/selenodomain-associated transferase 1 [Oleispira sp.]|jgi:rSAM/selenodomain-associated transferase 1